MNDRQSFNEAKTKQNLVSTNPEQQRNQLRQNVVKQQRIPRKKKQKKQDLEWKEHFRKQQAFELFRGFVCFFSGPVAIFIICFFAWAGKMIGNADLPGFLGSPLAFITTKTGFVSATLIVLGCVKLLGKQPEVEFQTGCLYFLWVIVCLVGGFAYFFSIANSLL